MSTDGKGGPPVVLIVDDEEALRSALAFDFELQGFEVLEASQGQEALGLLADHDVDLILTDVRMPVMGGLELLEQARDRFAEGPAVILLTGYSDLGLEEAHALGADVVIAKPFDRRKLMQAVRRALLPSRERWRAGDSAGDHAHGSTAHLEWRSEEDQSASSQASFRMGRRGFFFRSDASSRLQPQQSVTFRIQLPQLVLEGQGTVLWTRTSGVPGVPSSSPGSGIEIDSLTSSSLDSVLEYLSRQHPRASIPRY